MATDDSVPPPTSIATAVNLYDLLLKIHTLLGETTAEQRGIRAEVVQINARLDARDGEHAQLRDRVSKIEALETVEFEVESAKAASSAGEKVAHIEGRYGVIAAIIAAVVGFVAVIAEYVQWLRKP